MLTTDIADTATPYAEALPLYGIVWPSRISVAVTPGACFAGAIEARLEAEGFLAKIELHTNTLVEEVLGTGAHLVGPLQLFELAFVDARLLRLIEDNSGHDHGDQQSGSPGRVHQDGGH
jgi:hypothetical protein